MAAVSTLLNAVTTSATGSAVEVLTGRQISFAATYVAPGGFGPIFVEVSFDGVAWYPGLNVSPNSAPVAYSTPVKYVRAVYDASGGQTGAVTVQALQSDEDD